ncbi:MAG: cytochrome c5 family protein [Burkholderiaceae bacterium]|nr:MAG: cytochrome c5 family protein [Burkholderiaceae bacterium]
MSHHHNEHDDHDHETPIKTPKQLIIVVLAAFVVPIIAIVLLVQYVAHNEKTGAGSDAMTEQAIAERIKPVANPVIKDPNAAVVLKSGEEVFKTTCTGCHSAGLMGAPKVGDKAAWGPRIGQGLDTLFKHALDGYKQMPAQKGAFEDAEIRSAIVYMANQSGGSLKEPAAK